MPEQKIDYCTASDGVRIAYAVVGSGPPLVYAAGWPVHLEVEWQKPFVRRFLEDLDMHAFTFDTILTQLRDSGKLEAASGIVVGEMKNSGWKEDRAAFMQDMSLEDVLEEIVRPLGVPCVYGLPIGHGKHHVTVPYGARATLEADSGTLVVDEVVTID